MQQDKPRTPRVGFSRLLFAPRWVLDTKAWAQAVDEVDEALGDRSPNDAPSDCIHELTPTYTWR